MVFGACPYLATLIRHDSPNPYRNQAAECGERVGPWRYFSSPKAAVWHKHPFASRVDPIQRVENLLRNMMHVYACTPWFTWLLDMWTCVHFIRIHRLYMLYYDALCLSASLSLSLAVYHVHLWLYIYHIHSWCTHDKRRSLSKLRHDQPPLEFLAGNLPWKSIQRCKSCISSGFRFTPCMPGVNWSCAQQSGLLGVDV